MAELSSAGAMDSIIVTAADFNEDKYKLLQLNPELEQAVTTGSRVFIVGAPDARAVLCTEDKSYYIKKEDTSNLRLLTTHTDWSGPEETTAKRTIQVAGAARFHYLLEHKVPDPTKLRALLLEAPYEKPKRGAQVKRAKLSKLYSTRDLVAALQVSEHEVLAMLNEVHAFEEAGAWRLLGPAYQSQIFTDMLDTIVQHDWKVLAEPGVPLKQFLNELDEPLLAIRQCCKLYGSLKAVNGEDHCTLDAVKVATFRAKSLFDEQAAEAQFQAQQQHVALNPAEAGWELGQFMDKWKLRVPDSVSVNLEMLSGLVLVKPQKAGKPTRIVYFPEELLSPEPKKRFEQLFKMQEKWTISQLEPYIKSLVTPSTTQASLLLKNTRSSRQGNSTEKLYSRR
ncbi:Sister chromatid cohesion protein DCC1 [Phytophthora pseudosyringae]|uniref:Sister chromatid cohesion protein DCC1 n=1 Tax=Phytophthora pseudosyringae TaxID=221518 RepID=A0A8T1VSX2_9STRA|nr:Sister chromatid cohesion protein DCC1 [Phytophthora pseudosyringae]